MDEKDAFEFEDTGFHEPPEIPEPPSLDELGAEVHQAEDALTGETVGKASAAEKSAVPKAPEPASLQPAAQQAPQKPAEKMPSVEKEQVKKTAEAEAAKRSDTAPKPVTPSKPPHKPDRKMSPVRKFRPASRRIAETKPTVSEKGRVAPSPAPSPAPRVGAAKLPWVVAVIFLAGCAVLLLLLWRKSEELSSIRERAKAEVDKARKEANAELEKFRTKLKEMEAANQALMAAKQRLEKEKGELQRRLQEKVQNIESLTGQLKQVNSQLDSLRLRIKGLEESLSEKEGILKKQKQLTEEVLRKKSEVEERLSGYEAKVKRLTEELEKARREIARLKRFGGGAAVAHLMREKERLLQQIMSIEKENARLHEELAKAKFSGLSGSPRKRLSELRQRLARAIREKVALRRALLESNARLRRCLSPMETLNEWSEAVRSGDIRRVASLYSRNSSFWKRWTGAERKALEKEFEEVRAKGLSRMEVESVTIKGRRASAVVTFKYESGKAVRGVFHLVLEGDKWRIMSEEY